MNTTRRGFVKTGLTLSAGLGFAPSGVFGSSPQQSSESLNVAFVGVGGRGGADLKGISKGNNVYAMADVDKKRSGAAFKKFPKAQAFTDFRKMLDKVEKSIDAVVVATPDHTHAVAVMNALHRGKHVYCEKPLAHSVHEVQTIMKTAKEKGVVTQLGNQGHSSNNIRQCVEWIRDGAIGDVHTVHASCGAVWSKIDKLEKIKETPPVPADLDWDIWLGPAQERPYSPEYLPWDWRGWRPFGNGTIGDWVCHVVDPSFWALDLGAPESVELIDTTEFDTKKHIDTFAAGETFRFEFPAKGKRKKVTLFWYSGKHAAKMPVTEGKKPPKTGEVILGDKGAMMHGSHGASGIRILPDEKMKSYKQPEPTIKRAGNHHQDFVQAIREGRKAGSDFPSYGGPLTMLAMLGIVAQNFPKRKLTWDGAALKFTDCEEANALLNPPYRKGWSL